MSERRRYPFHLVVNGRRIHEVVIDPHYETKHTEINDALILELARGLDHKEFRSSGRDGEWEFFMLDRIEHKSKLYRLIWCMRDEHSYIGVINCFRR